MRLGELEPEEILPGMRVRSTLTGLEGTVLEVRDRRDIEIIIEWDDGRLAAPFWLWLQRAPVLEILED